MPRTLGLSYNPVSFYYLYEAGGRWVQAMIAEVTNTPWGERHQYVLDRSEPTAALGGRMAKRLHVSPFMPMEQVYEWSSDEPDERLGVRIANRERGELVFEASLALRRRELSPRAMTTVPAAHPPQVLAAIARIYGHAVRLRIKGARFHPHPANDSGAQFGAAPALTGVPRTTATAPSAGPNRDDW
jgi:DUF1365 family protein